MKVGTDAVLLGAWADVRENSQSGIAANDRDIAALGNEIAALDIGTGTGVIALMLAQRNPRLKVAAIDIDEAAARQAEDNAHNSVFADRVSVVHTAVQDFTGSFDVIVCNPPFFVNALEAPDEQRNIARHAVSLTYQQLMAAACRLLNDDGEISVVVPFDYCRQMEDEATFAGLFPSRKCAVRTTPSKPVRRYLLAFRKSPCRCAREEMVIGDSYYKELTQEFYL